MKLFRIILLCFFMAMVGILQAQVEEEDEYNQEPDSLMLLDSIGNQEANAYDFLEDFLLQIGYYFDSSLIPAGEHYRMWDTKKIHPYSASFDSLTKGAELILADSFDCFFHPPTLGTITSPFGLRRWGKRYKFHYGTDLALRTGDPVYAVFDGVVRIAQYSTSYGYVVVIRHYNGLETISAHFSKLLVTPGMSIRAGEPIGLGGSTGRSTGPHLHFEIRYRGVAFNPEKIIDFNQNTLKSDTLVINKELFDHLKEVNRINAARYHKVKSGENLGSIARKYGTSVTTIKKLNGMKGTTIRAGQTIRVR